MGFTDHEHDFMIHSRLVQHAHLLSPVSLNILLDSFENQCDAETSFYPFQCHVLVIVILQVIKLMFSRLSSHSPIVYDNLCPQIKCLVLVSSLLTVETR